MQKYLLTAEAKWVAHGDAGDGFYHVPQSKTLSVTFEANDLESARTEAKRLFTEFKDSLPKKRDGGSSWQDEDAEIVLVHFYEELELSPPPNECHVSHDTRSSDASSFDTICKNCGATDQVPGGWGNLRYPCRGKPIRKKAPKKGLVT